MKLLIKIKYFILIFAILVPGFVIAAILDTDNDGLTDNQEKYVYYTDWQNSDTDGDGFLDGVEIKHHFSPHQKNKTLSQTDLDGDGLSDWQEMLFGTDWNNQDTDGDGYSDYTEITNSFDPLNPKPVKLPQKIVINLSQQTLIPYLKNIPLAVFPISSGKPGYETPVGTFSINDKHWRAWSKNYGLWMPFWMSFIGSKYGIHELPEWSGGYKEGANHLGKPVSHGCVRLGVGPAEWLYNWTPIGTPVEVIK